MADSYYFKVFFGGCFFHFHWLLWSVGKEQERLQGQHLREAGTSSLQSVTGVDPTDLLAEKPAPFVLTPETVCGEQ